MKSPKRQNWKLQKDDFPPGSERYLLLQGLPTWMARWKLGSSKVFTPKGSFFGREMEPLISGKSRLLKYYNLLINGIYWAYNPFTNHLLTSWDIQAPCDNIAYRWLRTSSCSIYIVLLVASDIVAFWSIYIYRYICFVAPFFFEK